MVVKVKGDVLTMPDGTRFRCAIGRGGYAVDKREGDGTTPIGSWPFRMVYFRPDRGPPPETGLKTVPLTETDGWCDAPGDPAYNRPVTLPYSASHEVMWREDALYDIVVVLGHNDDPPIPGHGSAIFVHVARDGYLPTEGCVALKRDDLEQVLTGVTEGDEIAFIGP